MRWRRAGYPEVADRIQELWLAGRKEDAVAAVPDEYLERNTFLGDERRIRSRWAEYTPPAGATGFIVDGRTDEELRLVADLVQAG